MVSASINSIIKLSANDLPPGALEEIKRELTVHNVERDEAIERGDWGAEGMPEEFELWVQEGDDLGVPRGFAHLLTAGLERMGSGVQWVDQTSAPKASLNLSLFTKAPTLRPDQEYVLDELLRHRQGILQAETGFGKTVVLLEMWRRLGLRGIIFVEKGHLVRQWRERAIEHVGFEPGLIGDGAWEERDLTIAMLQTIHSRLDTLDDAWWRRWGLSAFDEAHHGVAPTYAKVLGRSTSSYLLGPTATPLDGDWRRPMLEAMIGPVVSQAMGGQLRPTIKAVKTHYKWKPVGDEAKLTNPGAVYQRIIADLVASPQRNHLVARCVVSQPEGCSQLVLSKRLEHLDLLRAAIVAADRSFLYKVFMLRGKESLDEREAVYERAGQGDCVILSTIGGEGMDIPRLDRLHLPYPQKKPLSVIQQVGRLLRRHPQKLDPVVFDYWDTQNVLRNQGLARIHGPYKEKGWPVEVL